MLKFFLKSVVKYALLYASVLTIVSRDISCGGVFCMYRTTVLINTEDLLFSVSFPIENGSPSKEKKWNICAKRCNSSSSVPPLINPLRLFRTSLRGLLSGNTLEYAFFPLVRSSRIR